MSIADDVRTTTDDTKSRLLEAAGREFAEKGFASATIRAICERAGANLAAVNYHFGDKQNLYTQAVIEAHRGCVNLQPEPQALDGLEPAEELRALVRHFLSNVLAVGSPGDWRHGLMLREMIQPTEASDALVREVIRPRFAMLSRAVTRLRPDLQGRDRDLAATVFSIVGQCLFYKVCRSMAERVVGPPAFAALNLDYLTDHITGVLLAALGSSPPKASAGPPVENEVKVKVKEVEP